MRRRRGQRRRRRRRARKSPRRGSRAAPHEAAPVREAPHEAPRAKHRSSTRLRPLRRSGKHRMKRHRLGKHRMKRRRLGRHRMKRRRKPRRTRLSRRVERSSSKAIRPHVDRLATGDEGYAMVSEPRICVLPIRGCCFKTREERMQVSTGQHCSGPSTGQNMVPVVSVTPFECHAVTGVATCGEGTIPRQRLRRRGRRMRGCCRAVCWS